MSDSRDCNERNGGAHPFGAPQEQHLELTGNTAYTVQCGDCDAVDALCEGCAAGLARARAYLDLGRELGLKAPG